MKRGKKEPKQAACRTSGMRTIVSLTVDEPPVHTRENGRAMGMVAKALSHKGKR